mmetsp:Transcript_35641/g.60656  ORF Transcript_35641/g.60656 Transcript_35641/m.60656 type:complete len:245 (-) Transcript_35641:494-1228(-)
MPKLRRDRVHSVQLHHPLSLFQTLSILAIPWLGTANPHNHPDEVHDIIVSIPQCSNEQTVPEWLASARVVHEGDTDILPRLNRLAYHRHLVGTGFRSLEEPTVAPQHLLLRVSCQGQKVVRGIHYRIVMKGRISNDEALLRVLNGLDEAKVLLIKLLDARVGHAAGSNSPGHRSNRTLAIHILCMNRAGKPLVGIASFQDDARIIGLESTPHNALERGVLALEVGHVLLEGFEEELFAEAGASS